MHHVSGFPKRHRSIRVPSKPTAAQICKRLKPVFVDARSKGKKKKVQFTGWLQKREVLVSRRAECLKHIVVLSILLVLVVATTLAVPTLPDPVANDVSPIEDAYVVEPPNLLEIIEGFDFVTVVPRAMFLGSVPDYVAENGPQINTSFYDPEEELVLGAVEDTMFVYDEFTSDIYSNLMLWEYPEYEEVVIEEEYVPYVPYIPYIPYEPVPVVPDPPPIVPAPGAHDAIVWNFFISRGFSPQATAGIIGNLQQESGGIIDPNKTGDLRLATPSRGIAQWREGRLADLQSFASARGVPWNGLEIQLEFMYDELRRECMQRRFRGERTSWANYMSNLNSKNATPVDGLEGFKQETCIENAVRVMDAAFHRSGTPNMPRRIRFANDAFANFYTGVSYPNHDEHGGPGGYNL